MLWVWFFSPAHTLSPYLSVSVSLSRSRAFINVGESKIMTHFTAHIILGFSFVFTLCMDVDAFSLLILLFRRIPEIQSRQFHLLLLIFVNDSSCSLFVQNTIVISTSFTRKKVIFKKVHILPEIIHTHISLNLNWISLCSHLKCETHLLSI